MGGGFSRNQGQREGTLVGGRGRGLQVKNFGQVHSGLMGSPSEETGVTENITFPQQQLMLWCDGSVEFCVIIHHGSLSSVSVYVCTVGPKMLRAISSRNGENSTLNY